ncbi:hypothetical protein KBC80_01590 [Candidatus Woesebacteria bacterium]|jgi:hypothetical protein|nr:hypothetical protein [Candidatus Woesebacteria bacterium]
MLKNMLAPVQAWLLSQGKCVGCGKPLASSDGKGLARIDCVCGRIYMYDSASRKYRRALINEIK